MEITTINLRAIKATTHRAFTMEFYKIGKRFPSTFAYSNEIRVAKEIRSILEPSYFVSVQRFTWGRSRIKDFHIGHRRLCLRRQIVALKPIRMMWTSITNMQNLYFYLKVAWKKLLPSKKVTSCTLIHWVIPTFLLRVEIVSFIHSFLNKTKSSKIQT